MFKVVEELNMAAEGAAPSWKIVAVYYSPDSPSLNGDCVVMMNHRLRMTFTLAYYKN